MFIRQLLNKVIGVRFIDDREVFLPVLCKEFGAVAHVVHFPAFLKTDVFGGRSRLIVASGGTEGELRLVGAVAFLAGFGV